MDKKFLKLMFSVMTVIGLVGCGGGGSSTPSGEETKTATQEINATVFDTTTGEVKEDVLLNVGGGTATTIKIDAGTSFVTDAGETVTAVPEAKVEVTKSTTKSEINVDFVADKKSVNPEQPIVVSVPVPKGAKEGDIVDVTIPEGISLAKIQKSTTIQVKVQKGGVINLKIEPIAFKKEVVIIIKTKDNSTN